MPDDEYKQFTLEKPKQGNGQFAEGRVILATPKNVIVGDVNPDRYSNGWLNYTPIATGFSSYTVAQAKYEHIGKRVEIYVDITGTSNAATFTFSLPAVPTMPAGQQRRFPCRVTDNSSVQSAPGLVEINPDSTNASVGRTYDNTGGFTAANTKRVEVSFTYEAKASFFDAG